MDTAAAALRGSTVEIETYGPLAQALFLAGVVLLMSLFVGFAFWRIYRTTRNH